MRNEVIKQTREPNLVLPVKITSCPLPWREYSILTDLTVHVNSCIDHNKSLLYDLARYFVQHGNQSYLLKYPVKIELLATPTRFTSSSFEASLILSTDSKCFNKISFVFGPIPFIWSRSDFIISEERLSRWKLIPNLWASFLNCCMILRLIEF